MMTAHVMEFGIEVDVPKTRTVKESAKELPIVFITRDGNLYLNERPVGIHELAAIVKRQFGAGQSVYLRADKATPFDPIAQVMAALGEAKVGVNVVTQPEDSADKRKR
jgi:biopolymer transport protein ExbD/biopolymer transport protein TolR